MVKEKTSVLSNGMIWFGAAVSIAEIMTGALIAPLGFAKGVAAIVLGHLVGCVLMYFAGTIGGKTGKNAMETVGISFGGKGSGFFAALNVLQLVGWTAVMIIGGARATGAVANPALGTHGEALWCVLIGVLTLLWVSVGLKNLNRLNLAVMSALFLLTVVLSAVVFRGGSSLSVPGEISFGAAVELSATMPLSWLPLISDYTKSAEKPRAAAAASTIVYFFTSCWMYVIGLGAAIFTAQSDIAQIMLQSGLGVAGVLIVILSTVTTVFLDVYSAGVSAGTIWKGLPEKRAGVVVCLIGTLLAVFTPIEQYENFLYLIGSVFAPMISILIVDFFLLKKDSSQDPFDLSNFILWLIGFVIYRLFLSIDTVIGSTLPVMILTALLCIFVNGGKKYVQNHFGKRRE